MKMSRNINLSINSTLNYPFFYSMEVF